MVEVEPNTRPFFQFLVEMADHPFQYDKAIFTPVQPPVRLGHPRKSYITALKLTHLRTSLISEVASQMEGALQRAEVVQAAWLGMTGCADGVKVLFIWRSDGMSFLQNPNFWAMKLAGPLWNSPIIRNFPIESLPFFDAELRCRHPPWLL